MPKKSIELLNMPKIFDDRGNLTFIENEKHVPFKIKRVYWIYDVPGGEIRGGHAYKNLEEVIIALSGSFEVKVDDGLVLNKIYDLNRSYKGLYIPGNTWREIRHFSTNSVALILASRAFEKDDYIYNYDTFIQHASEENAKNNNC